MIFRPCQDALRAVELLERHDAHEVVRERHFAERQAEIRHALDARVDAERRADQKARRAAAVELFRLQTLGQTLGRKLRPLRREHAEPRAARELCLDLLRLARKTCCDLRPVRIVRQAALRQLDQLEFAVGPEPADILVRRCRVIALLELADRDERDVTAKTFRCEGCL